MTEKLLQGDCLELLPTIKSDSIDLILCDPPYGNIKELKKLSWLFILQKLRRS
jgi:DNA modification methylase